MTHRLAVWLLLFVMIGVGGLVWLYNDLAYWEGVRSDRNLKMIRERDALNRERAVDRARLLESCRQKGWKCE